MNTKSFEEALTKELEKQKIKQDPMQKKSDKPKLKLIPVAGTKNRVFIEPVKQQSEKLSVGGLIIPNVHMGESNEDTYEKFGKVISVSTSDELGVKPNVKSGETVYFDMNYKVETFEGIEYLVMKEGNIYAKL